MPGWREREAALDARLAGAFGEEVLISFQKNGVPDPDREAVTVIAILYAQPAEADVIGSGQSSAARSRLALGRARLTLHRASYTGPLPRAGDRVRASARDGQPWFEVALVSDRMSNLIMLDLAGV